LQRASDLATDIARLRTRYTTVDGQLHNLMLENSAPGAVHLSLAAVAPLHPTISGILKKALLLALGGVLLGLLAAVLANYLDPRVYIGADVETKSPRSTCCACPRQSNMPARRAT
jgi:hypothetical protein